MNSILNKKVKNATRLEIDGITFKSKLEAYTYEKLKAANIYAEYETHRYELLPAFTFKEAKYRAITYKPDFIGNNFIIECKGFPNDSWPLREKLFCHYLSTHNVDINFYVVHNRKEVDELISKLK